MTMMVVIWTLLGGDLIDQGKWLEKIDFSMNRRSASLFAVTRSKASRHPLVNRNLPHHFLAHLKTLSPVSLRQFIIYKNNQCLHYCDKN